MTRMLDNYLYLHYMILMKWSEIYNLENVLCTLVHVNMARLALEHIGPTICIFYSGATEVNSDPIMRYISGSSFRLSFLFMSISTEKDRYSSFSLSPSLPSHPPLYLGHFAGGPIACVRPIRRPTSIGDACHGNLSFSHTIKAFSVNDNVDHWYVETNQVQL